MTTKDFLLKVAYYKPFLDAAVKFGSNKTDHLFMACSQFHDCHGTSFKTTLFTYYADVDIYACDDEQLDFVIIDRYSRADFKRDMQFFHDFYVKCSESQKDKLRSELYELCVTMDILFTNSLNK